MKKHRKKFVIPELPEELFPDSSTDSNPAIVHSLPPPLFSEMDVPSPPSAIPAVLFAADVIRVEPLDDESENTSVEAVLDRDPHRCVLSEDQLTALGWEWNHSIAMDQMLALPSSVLEQFAAEAAEQL